MRLTELAPRWAVDLAIVIGGVQKIYEGRHGMAISFDCPHCRTERLAVWFANPIDGLPPPDDAKKLWRRVGDTFDTLTLRPSIDASQFGHWHGVIVDGEVK